MHTVRCRCHIGRTLCALLLHLTGNSECLSPSHSPTSGPLHGLVITRLHPYLAGAPPCRHQSARSCGEVLLLHALSPLPPSAHPLSPPCCPSANHLQAAVVLAGVSSGMAPVVRAIGLALSLSCEQWRTYGFVAVPVYALHSQLHASSC